MADRIFRYKPGVIRKTLNRIDAPREVHVNDITFEIYEEIVDRIKNRQTSWPIRTGNSLLGFFARSDGVWNTEDYAKYIEDDFKHITEYATNARAAIVRAALDALGFDVDRRVSPRRNPRTSTFDFFARQLRDIANITREL